MSATAKSAVGEPEAVRDERARLSNGPVFDETELRRKMAKCLTLSLSVGQFN